MKFENEQSVRQLIIEKLSDPKVDINCCDDAGYTALTFSMKYGFGVNVIEELIAVGADINFEDKKHFTPLLAAVKHAHYQNVLKLIQLGADVNLASSESLTPLALARSESYFKIANLLEAKVAAIKYNPSRMFQASTTASCVERENFRPNLNNSKN